MIGYSKPPVPDEIREGQVWLIRCLCAAMTEEKIRSLTRDEASSLIEILTSRKGVRE